jgi:chemosensory pili system protein ChpA (sensor histidine kinase/response regulator)
MNTAAELDVGPLTWVKGEIDLALERAVEALDRHGAEGEDASQLLSARNHLHQAHGALSIVGLDGVTRFSESLEQLLEAVENGEIGYEPRVADAAHEGIAAIRHYLEDLIAGQPDQPLRLLPALRAVAEARGLPEPAPSELFFPDLSLRPPRRETEPQPLTADELRIRGKAARTAFQRGLLKWLKDDDLRGVMQMREALAIIEKTQVQPSARAFWWAALAFLDAIAAGSIAGTVPLRRLCARIDIQIRKLIEGSRTVAERLMRDTLYYVASAGPAGDHAECVRAAFRLAELIPAPAASGDIEPLRPVLRACREQLGAAMEDWNRFCAGTAAALPQFHDRIRSLASQLTGLHNADLSRLGSIVLSTGDYLRKEPLSHNEAIGLEVATALLLMDYALDSFQRLEGEFTAQVSAVAARLDAVLRGRPVAAMEMPHLDEMSRRAQEKLLMSQVVREILANLVTIEQTLDAFFRDPTKTADLAGLGKPVKQVEGALTVLGQDRAVTVLRECETVIEGFAAEGHEPRLEDFEDVASKLSALGFFVEQLQYGPADIDAILNPVPLVPEDEPAPEPTAEAEMAAAQRQAQSLVDALRAQPEDAGLRGEIRHNLEMVRENAQLVDDDALVEKASAAIAALAADQPSLDIAEAVAQIAPTEAPVTAPSAEVVRLAEASSEEVDAELLGIFIEEAHEVLAAVGAQQPQLAAQRHDRDTLTNIRRSFHTLKGSGRMVGLGALGEAAWAVEQVLNRWLQQEQEATPALLAMIGQAHQLFTEWVAQLEAGGGIHRDASALVSSCEQLKGEVVAPPPLPPIEPEVEAETASALPADEDLGTTAIFAATDITPAADDLSTTAIFAATEAGEPADELGRTAIFPATDTPEVVPDLMATVIMHGSEIQASSEDLAATAIFPAFEGTEAETPGTAETAPDLVMEFPEIDTGWSEATAELPEPEIDLGIAAAVEPVVEEVLEPAAEAEPAMAVAADAEAIEPTEPEAEEPSPPQPDSVHIGDLVLSPTLYELYTNEAQGHVATLSHELGMSSPPHHAQIRAAHTLAGISATTGIDAIHDLAHALEMALGRLSNAGLGPNEQQHLLFARTVGALEGMVGAVAERRLPQTEAALAAELDDLGCETLAPAPTLSEAPPEVPPDLAATALSEDVGTAEIDAVPAEPVAVVETVGIELPVPEAVAPLPPPEPTASTAALIETAEGERRHLRLKDDLDPQLLPIFLEEAVDLAREIGSELRNWREHPDNAHIADRLKRLLHTFKGSARMAGAMGLGELVHGMETRVDIAVTTNGVTPDFLDTLDGSFDRATMFMEQLQSGEAPVEEEVPAAAQAVPEHVLEVPTARSELLPSVVPEHAPMAALDLRAEAPADAEGVARAMLRVRADIVDKLVNEAGEIAIARGRIEGEMRTLKNSLLDLTENVIRLRNQLREVEIQAESQMQSRQSLVAEKDLQFDPLEFDRFTRFQELTRMMAESVNDVATSQQALLQNLDHADAAITAQARLNRELSQALMSVRMVPFNTMADRLYRIVRQTAKELGKRANLDIRGGQTELDRSVLEKMTGPLEHLLRNAIAHGLETPEQRLATGKAEIGEIALRVAQEGNEVVIELADDGAGLDLERIRGKGVALGLIGTDDPVSPEQLTQLIFRSGLSTADELTAVSGRGVGMDVVRDETASLGGRIEVDSTPGKGARFRVYLPLTLAITQAVLVRVGSRHYAIPASMVAQVSELKLEAIAAIRAEGGTTWLGDRYPIRYLPHLLGDTTAQPEPARRYWLLLLRTGSQHLAIEVDDLVGNQELVVKNIGPQLARVVGIAGATVLGDGEIALILNPIALAGREAKLATAAAAGGVAAVPAAPVTQSTAGVVMVVDDSLTVRKITGRLLAREGYHVLTAKDGVDALEQLIDVTPDVLLVDIEMPRMDGFDLTRNVRADARLKDVPIIMITSRIADKHRNYATEIGVNNYLGKPYDEEELLGLIAGYVRR